MSLVVESASKRGIAASCIQAKHRQPSQLSLPIDIIPRSQSESKHARRDSADEITPWISREGSLETVSRIEMSVMGVQAYSAKSLTNSRRVPVQ